MLALITLLFLIHGGIAYASNRVIEPPGMGFMICDTDLTNCLIDKQLMQQRAQCYQRMQNIISAMDAYHDQRGAFVPPQDLEGMEARRAATRKLFGELRNIASECLAAAEKGA